MRRGFTLIELLVVIAIILLLKNPLHGSPLRLWSPCRRAFRISRAALCGCAGPLQGASTGGCTGLRLLFL